MRILIIADIHGDLRAVEKAKEWAEGGGIEHILILGDFLSYESYKDPELASQEVRRVLELLEGFELLAIPGNCDPQQVLEVFEEFGANLHEARKELGGVEIVGFGGSSPTPFDTPFEMEESVIEQKLEDLLAGLAGLGPEKLVLALHCPPANTSCDELSSGAHAGSQAIRKLIENHQPALAICSHVHESAGKEDRIGKTRVLNVGPVSRRNAALLETKRVELEHLKL